MSGVILWVYAGLMRLAAGSLRSWLRDRAEAGKEDMGRIGERRGRDLSLRPPGPVIWLHAASVGEVTSIFPVIDILRAQPGLRVLITTGTRTSARLVERHIRATNSVRIVEHRFVPLDVPLWVERFVDHWKPAAVGMVESELWPNLLAEIHRRKIPLLLINARLSDRSYRRWKYLRGVARRVLGNFSEIQAQSDEDAERLRRLGGRHVSSPGNLKFAAPLLPVDDGELARMRHRLGGRPVWLAASTHPGEEKIAVAVHRALLAEFPTLITIVVPRHPERGEAIAAEIVKREHDLVVTRRHLGEPPPGGGIWLGDTLGELGLFYRLAPVAFVGRSLAVGGGQNPIEPARLGVAVAIGPRTENFADAVAVLAQAGALRVVADQTALAEFVGDMLRHPEQAAAMGQDGKAATGRCAELPQLVASRLLSLAGLSV
ncbi:MAG: 3-deoxy-D-manno-octulosonic acid transferase [Acetobacteraceae bacterium]|nr:3-deoxy-D-manno-octulosonic acid transferase [Acetobacteraceae bacterium]